ncbi:hypothetical protein AVEN_256795-1 [Araneus ventricosus]|uniref:HTH CENPB-type domain-containing protein n=1 Tax=Araneus ventricosus TaxID=182803 RepID=A0A4Y2NJC2_ARAVE|nr:hypothetical protein AVEN_256795-1 [Araneus ventricosus]
MNSGRFPSSKKRLGKIRFTTDTPSLTPARPKIRLARTEPTKPAVAKEHHIPRTTLNDILSSKQVIEESDCKDKRKRIRKSKFYEIEEVLVQWLKHARSQNVPISALILKEKAIEIAEKLNIEDFCGSNGWL